MERWERELERLKDVDAPASTKGRMDAGPTGDGMPPKPNRGQRIAAGVVACVVFLVGASLVVAAFRDGTMEPLVVPAPEGAVLTLKAEPNDAIATLSFEDATIDGVADSHCWNQENGAQMCADVFVGPLEGQLSIPEGTAFTLVNDDQATVGLSVVPGSHHRPGGMGGSVTIEELSRLGPGDHVVTVLASWEGRGTVTFHFPVHVDAIRSSPSPTVTPSPSSNDEEVERRLTGTSWSLGQLDGAMLDIDEPPTAIFSTARLVGFNGCNGYGAEDWSIEDGRLVTGEIAQTLILCPDSLEGRFMEILAADPLVTFDGTRLVLTSDDGSMVFDRIDVEHEDVVGSFLDCWTGDRVEVGPTGNAIMEPAPPSYFTVNLPWIERSDELERIAGSPELDEPSRWTVVRDGLVIAEVNYPDLTGVACSVSGA